MTAAGGTIAIVLHYRREAMTAQCIRSLEASTRPPRVLVVDNLSGDGSYERLQQQFPRCDFLQTGGNYGYAGGNNRGIEWALARGAARVLVINDDATVEPDALALLEDALASDVAIAAPTIVFGSRPEMAWWAGGEFSELRMIGRHGGYSRPVEESVRSDSTAAQLAAREVSFISGCCLLIDADALRELGAFDASYHAYVEDVDLSLRYTRAGKRLLWVLAARAAHHLPYPEPEPGPHKIVARDRNRRRLARKHFGFISRAKFSAFFAASRTILMLKYAATGDMPRAKAIAEGWFGRL